MATRSIVPRADNEGGLGTSLKKWAAGFIKLLTVDTINKVTITTPAMGSTLTVADGKTLTVNGDVTLSGAVVHNSLFDANTILAANTDDTPAALTVAEQRIVGRMTAGNIASLTAAQVRTMLAAAPFVLGSDADGDMWYRASSALARLAKGDANSKVFMNAGGTAPEWSSGLKVGSFTRDASLASGDVSYTGVGFKPSAIIFLAQLSNTSISVGVDDATTHLCLLDYSAGVYSYTTASVNICVSAGYSAGGVVKSMDSDGFTITWTKYATPTGTGTITYLALR